uniref:Solute carrier family 26 member 8 n=1 Tax=Cairina moschata TaxID=8855 RepID=A0A8C3CGL1_CAIMO
MVSDTHFTQQVAAFVRPQIKQLSVRFKLSLCPPAWKKRKIQMVSLAVVGLWREIAFRSLNTGLLLGSHNGGDPGWSSLQSRNMANSRRPWCSYNWQLICLILKAACLSWVSASRALLIPAVIFMGIMLGWIDDILCFLLVLVLIDISVNHLVSLFQFHCKERELSLWSPVFAVPRFFIVIRKKNMELDNDTVRTCRQPAVYSAPKTIKTEKQFEAFLERSLPSTLRGELQTPQQNRRLHCRFSWERFRKLIRKMFPVLNWLFSYQFKEWILRDLHAGLNIGMFQIPQGLLGIWLTRLPLPMVNCFLSTFCCSMLYVIFGTSHHISVGSFSILNLVVKNILKSFNFNQTLSFNGSVDNFSDPTLTEGYMEALTLTASVTFLTGIIQLLLGCFCLGFVTKYLPKTLVDAYLTAAALHVIVSQFIFIFGIMLDFHKGPRDIFCDIFHYFRALPKANATSTLLFSLSLPVLWISKCISITYKRNPIAFPMELLLELIAVGLCNICSSFFKSFAISCAISGTVIQEKTGGRTQLAAMIGASIMLVIALKLGYFFQMIPNGVLAAIVVFNMLPFLQKFLDIPTLWRQDKYHLVIWLGTFAAVLRLGLDVGLVIALALAFFIISIRSHRMKMVELGQIPNTNIYRSLSVYRAATEIEGVKIFQCCSSISFANMNNFKNYLLRKMDMKAVPLDQSEMRDLISDSWSDSSLERKDFECSCVCDQPLPPPRIPYTARLVKRSHTGRASSSSSVNLVRWSKNGDRHNSKMLLVGTADAQLPSPGTNTGDKTEKKEDEGKGASPLAGSAIDNSSVQLGQEEDSVDLSCPVHTIILDFSMVQYVDLQGSDLLKEIIHMFRDAGITVFIAGCHPSVIAVLEKNDFFVTSVTKRIFFLTLHDAVLAALEKHQKPDGLQLSSKEVAHKLQAKHQKEIESLLEKTREFSSTRSSDTRFLCEVPPDISCSAQNEAGPSPLRRFDSSSFQPDFEDPGWEKRWK